MEHELEKLPLGRKNERIPLYAGIDLSYIDIVFDPFPFQHEPMEHIMQINYCKGGQVAWKTRNSNSVFLNPGDFSVHTPDACIDSSFHFPTGQYQGLVISIDLRKASAHPPESIAETGVFDGLLQEKFFQNNTISFLAGNEQSESIFSGFYDQPEKLKLPYQRIKVLELLLYLTQMEFDPPSRLLEYQAKQVEIVREVHDQLLQHMEQRVTIEALSKQYLINPTTLKSAFKAVYGTSLAAHIKKHRMEQAAKLLRETDMSIAEIAQAVGYDSQSKFTTSFKAFFQVLPREYRKNGHQLRYPYTNTSNNTCGSAADLLPLGE